MHLLRWLPCVALLAYAASSLAQTQTENGYLSRQNTFGVLAAYSNNSRPTLLGSAESRKLLNFGVFYERRLWIGRVVNWQYDGEILPVALESDPVEHRVTTYTAPKHVVTQEEFVPIQVCRPASGAGSFTTPNGIKYVYTYVNTCSREWTIGEGISPVGMQWNFLPRHKLQPFFVGHGGYMYSTHPIPEPTAGAFNFTFDLGFGVEMWRSRTRSLRAEYRYHHISNAETAPNNPGIDSEVFQVEYAFGR